MLSLPPQLVKRHAETCTLDNYLVRDVLTQMRGADILSAKLVESLGVRLHMANQVFGIHDSQ
jgi:hypothetical protein